MTTDTHSPGPFKLGNWNHIVDADGKSIAQVRYRKDANNFALLIASHDMLAALELAAELVTTARQYFPASIKHADRFALENKGAAINAAIAKAKGGR